MSKIMYKSNHRDGIRQRKTDRIKPKTFGNHYEFCCETRDNLGIFKRMQQIKEETRELLENRKNALPPLKFKKRWTRNSSDGPQSQTLLKLLERVRNVFGFEIDGEIDIEQDTEEFASFYVDIFLQHDANNIEFQFWPQELVDEYTAPRAESFRIASDGLGIAVWRVEKEQIFGEGVPIRGGMSTRHQDACFVAIELNNPHWENTALNRYEEYSEEDE